MYTLYSDSYSRHKDETCSPFLSRSNNERVHGSSACTLKQLGTRDITFITFIIGLLIVRKIRKKFRKLILMELQGNLTIRTMYIYIVYICM